MVSYETVRRWVNHFGPKIAADLRKRRPKPHTTWHLDEVYLKIDGRMVYLWRGRCYVIENRAQHRRNPEQQSRRGDERHACMADALKARCVLADCQMALDVESVICGCVGCEKSLRGSDALEPLHLALPSSGWQMRILGSIVAPSTAFMASRDSKITGCGGIKS
jgi:hypothetical protein